MTIEHDDHLQRSLFPGEPVNLGTSDLDGRDGGFSPIKEGINPERVFLVNGLTREDLRDMRPDASDRIDALTDEQMQFIADRLGSALQDAYWDALSTILMRQLPYEVEEGVDEDE